MQEIVSLVNADLGNKVLEALFQAMATQRRT